MPYGFHVSDVWPPPLPPGPPRLPPVSTSPSTSPWAGEPRIETPLITPEPVIAPRKQRRPWALVAAVLVVLVAGVGALLALAGGSSGDSDGSYALAAAAQEVADAGTAQFEMVVSVGSLDDVTMTGAIDNDAQLMTMSMDLGDAVGVEGSMEMIIDVAGGVMYVSADGFGAPIPTEAEWFSMDLATVAEMSGGSLEDLQDLAAVDPLASAELLLDENATEIGTEEIDGESVMHYQVSIDLEETLAANPQAQQQLDDAGIDGDLPETIVYDVWVTADDELRRIVFEVPVLGETLQYQLDLRSVGEPLDVEIPSGDNVFDLTDLFGA